MSRASTNSFLSRVMVRRVLALVIMMVAAYCVQKFYGKPPKPRTTEQVYKNIQVLKGIPAEELYTTMVSFNSALGVSCEYCHVSTQYYKDDKKSKQAARRMILAQTAINRDQFSGQVRVTCYSCHRGAVEVPLND